MSLASHNFQHMPALLDKMEKYFDDSNDDRLDFKEFAMFMRNFLPDASDEQLEQMFKNIDTDDLCTITKKQLMDSAFFTEFIRTSDKMFDMREHELLNQRQEEIINQLQEYINTIGRPAEFDNERLKQELRDLKEEKRFVDRQNEELRREVALLQGMELTHREEIELLQREQEDQVDEIRELHLRAVESAESTNELAIIQKDLDEERERAKQLQDRVRTLTEANRDCESQLRQCNLEKKKLEMQNDRLRDKNDRLIEDLAQCSDQWKVERVRADTLAETVIILESSLDDQNEIMEERDRLSQEPVMRINSDGFVLGGSSVTDAEEEGDDLFSEIQDDSSVILSIPVSVFEATPEPTASPRLGLKRVVKRAKKYAHRRSKSAYIPLVTPRGRRQAETPNLLALPTGLDPIAHSPTSSVKSKESVEVIQNTIQREMHDVGERIVESLKPQVDVKPDRSEEVLAALARLQDELSVLKRDMTSNRQQRNTKSVDGEPKWASQMKRDIAIDTKRTVTRLLEEVKEVPTQGRGGCCLWPWSTRTGSEYEPLNGN